MGITIWSREKPQKFISDPVLVVTPNEGQKCLGGSIPPDRIKPLLGIAVSKPEGLCNGNPSPHACDCPWDGSGADANEAAPGQPIASLLDSSAPTPCFPKLASSGKGSHWHATHLTISEPESTPERKDSPPAWTQNPRGKRHQLKTDTG